MFDIHDFFNRHLRGHIMHECKNKMQSNVLEITSSLSKKFQINFIRHIFSNQSNCMIQLAPNTPHPVTNEKMHPKNWNILYLWTTDEGGGGIRKIESLSYLSISLAVHFYFRFFNKTAGIHYRSFLR